MIFKVITVATRHTAKVQALVDSVTRNGMEIEVLGIGENWQGFGMKIISTVEYLKSSDLTHFIFVDAYDTLFWRPITEVPDRLLFSTEKNCWPDADAKYPESEKTWRYLNSGVYMGSVKELLRLVEKVKPEYADDDQRYFTNHYLNGEVDLDQDCEHFQSYAFSDPSEFTIGTVFKNNSTGTKPAVIHFNGKCHDERIYRMQHFQTLGELQSEWRDNPETHKRIHESFVHLVNDNPDLNLHRTFVEQNIFGFGERSFHWMWNLIVKEMPTQFTFLEIGVFKGQVLTLMQILATMYEKKVKRYGITPLSTEGGVWESDYKRDIEFFHEQFGMKKDYTILQGLSEDPEIIKQAQNIKTDILFIDGGHEERHVINDIEHYAHLVKPGGYLIFDDACNSFQMPFGYFQGIQAVTKVVDERLPITGTEEWEFIASVVHNRIYKRK